MAMLHAGEPRHSREHGRDGGNLPTRRVLVWAAALVTLGVATLFALSFVGGIGGETGRSMLWALLLLPYVVGWLLALGGGVRSLGGGRLRHAS